MNTELTAQLRAFLNEQGEVSSSAAPGLKLLRQCLVALEKDQAPAVVAQPPARDHVLEEFAYNMLAELGLVPETDGEPVSSWPEAVALNTDLPEEAISHLAGVVEAAENSVSVELAQLRDFADTIRHLLGATADATPDMLLGQLQEKARYIGNLEQGITERDQKLAGAEALLTRCLEAAELDWDNIDKLPSTIGWFVVTARVHESGVQDTREHKQPQPVDDDVVDPHVQLVHQQWLNDAIDLARAVAGNIAPENRVMAKAAKAIILHAPGVHDG